MGGTGCVFCGDTVGRWRIETDIVNGRPMKCITCKTAGLLYIPTTYFGQNTTEAAFGTWEFWMYKLDANTLEMIIGDVIGSSVAVGQDGYVIRFTNAERIWIFKITNGAWVSDMFYTNINHFLNQTWYKIRVSRSSVGVFTGYENDTLIGDIAVGSNPSVADVTHTVSPYVILDMDAGDKIGWSDQGNQAFKKQVIAT